MSQVLDVLGDEEDAFGRLLLDHIEEGAGDPLLEFDDGSTGPAMGSEWFFAEPERWPSAERTVFGHVRGRVLDIGAGGGRHSLEAQRLGSKVVAIDVSPGAVEVCRRRGVKDIRLLSLAAVDDDLGVFDTVLMMCGNFGLVGNAEAAAVILRRLYAMTTPQGRIVLDSVDPYVDADAEEIASQARNRARGRMPGQVTMRLRYRERATPWYDLLNISAAELAQLVAGTGWRVAQVIEGEPPDFYALLEKA
jgi:2-polyprenyl-3-methyl-5-hydroxy-6-metoxy-1,4-benzoquinol methylase